jgi:hypothetical protein
VPESWIKRCVNLVYLRMFVGCLHEPPLLTVSELNDSGDRSGSCIFSPRTVCLRSHHGITDTSMLLQVVSVVIILTSTGVAVILFRPRRTQNVVVLS